MLKLVDKDGKVQFVIRDSDSEPVRIQDLAPKPVCEKCGQTDQGQTGENPCPVCGLPTVSDEKE